MENARALIPHALVGRRLALLLWWVSFLLAGHTFAAPPGSPLPAPPQANFEFIAYDGKPEVPASMSFQLNRLDGQKPSTEFLRLGDLVIGGRHKVQEFRFRTRVDTGRGEVDVSELVLLDTVTNKPLVLVLGPLKEGVSKAK